MNYMLKSVIPLCGVFLVVAVFLYCGDPSVGSIGGDDEVVDILRYCKNSAQCSKDEECINHRCVKKQNYCRNSSDCSWGEECVEGRCVSLRDADVEDVITEDVSPIDVDLGDTYVSKQRITAEPMEVDFGALRFGERGERRLLVRNIGDSPLKVFSIALEQSGDKVVFSFTTDFVNNTVLRSGDYFEILVSCTQDDADVDTGYLLISSDDEQMPLLRIRLFNSYKDRADVRITYIDSENKKKEYPDSGDSNEIEVMVGNIPVGEMKEQVFRISNVAEYGILKIKGRDFDPFNRNGSNVNKFSARIYDPVRGETVDVPVYMSGGEYIEVRVEYRGEKEAEEDRYDIHIRFNDLDVNNDGDEGEEGLLMLRLKAQAGYVPPKVVVVDEVGEDIIGRGIDFGEVERGRTEKRYFKICNGGGGVLKIDKGSGLVNNNFILNPPNLETVLSYSQCLNADLTFSPNSIGNVRDRMVVISNDEKNPEVSFGVEGVGVDPEVKVEPLNINFGGVSVNTEATPYKVKVTNIGYGRVAIDSIGLSVGSSSDFSLSNLPQSYPVFLSSSEFLSFTVGFRPSDMGTKRGSIEIKSSDIDNPSISVVLEGSGSNCDTDHMDCNNNPIDGCEVNITNSLEHCGGCNRTCNPANAIARCINRQCIIESCTGDYRDCNNDVSDGCESDVMSSISNCGFCFNNCGDNTLCDRGNCVCKSGFKNCDGNQNNGCEIDVQTDVNHCGDCSKRCATDNTFVNKCENGECKIVICNSGFMDCDGIVANGCEVNLQNDVNNCGNCGNRCNLPNTSQVACENRNCKVVQCANNYANCDNYDLNGCEIDVLTDNNNCGVCNNRCNNNAFCAGGNCKCNTGYSNCNNNWSDGCEVNTANDVNNCGSCGNRCNQNAQCVNSICQCLPGYANCNNDWSDGCELLLTDDPPDDGFNDSNCDGIDGDKNKAIFVDSVTGNDSNSGLFGSPVKTITKGLEKAAAYSPPRYLIVSEGTYTETFTLRGGVSIFGGYSRANNWSRSNSYIVNVNCSSSGIQASNITIRTDVDRINIYAADASAGASSYGMFVQNSSNIYINRSTIRGGKGGNGANGANGANGMVNNPSNMNGVGGQPGCEDSSGFCDTCSQPQGGSGGTSVCGMHGGRGGNAGRSSNWGSAGSAGIGPSGNGGAGGGGSEPGRGSAPPYSWQYGGNGPAGANGSNGAAGVAFGSLGVSGYVASNNGGDGGQGSHGAGGGGGGGGGGGTADCDSYGSSGGGGGAGGCGGYGGRGGDGGGASIGIYLSNSAINITYSTIAAQNGGNGGGGGVGGSGSAGGSGGSGGPYGGGSEQDDGSMGGPGGNGGRGGNGGYGGGGGGGPSVCIVKYGSSTANITSVTFSRGAGGSGGWGGGGNSGWNGISVDIYP